MGTKSFFFLLFFADWMRFVSPETAAHHRLFDDGRSCSTAAGLCIIAWRTPTTQSSSSRDGRESNRTNAEKEMEPSDKQNRENKETNRELKNAVFWDVAPRIDIV
jgi:hypothetical protein